MNIVVAIVAESSIIFSFLFFCFSIGIWKLDVFNGGFVGTIISVDVDIAKNVVGAMLADGQEVESVLVNLVYDINELNGILVVDIPGTAHFEVKVDATTLITKSAFEES